MADEAHWHLSLEDEAALDEAAEQERAARHPTPLPTHGDQLFKTDADQERTWQHKTFEGAQTYITGYSWAADHLFAYAQQSAKDAREKKGEFWAPMSIEHWLIYPVYFLYRHAIELSLKDILRSADRHGSLTKEQTDLMTTCHDVYKLWIAAKSWVMSFAQTNLHQETPAFESMLKEIQTHDPNAESGRYDMRRVGRGNQRQLVATFEGLAPLDLNAIHNNSQKMLNYITWIWSSYEEWQQQEENRKWWEEREQREAEEYARWQQENEP